MPAPQYLVALTAACALAASALVGSDAAAKAPAPWTPPDRIPGTVGEANPVSATAPDGTDLVTWQVPGDGMFVNDLMAKLRLPGRTQWRSVPIRLSGVFLQGMVIAPTPSGDFWLAYEKGFGAGSSQVFLSRLDSQTRRWSKPVKVFKQPGYGHAGASIALAGDGTLVVGAYAPPVDDPGDPNYRAAVATRAPGKPWKSRFLSPANRSSSAAQVAANSSGDIVASFIQDDASDDGFVRAATKAHGKTAKWKVSTLSAALDTQRAHSAIGDDGTAAVVWTSPRFAPFTTVRMATREVRRRLAPWVGRDVITGVSVDIDAHAVVDRRGDVTTVWRQIDGAAVTLWSRHFDGASLGDPVRLTPNGEVAEFDGLVQRPDGKAGLLYQRFTTTIDSLGVRFRTLKGGVPGPVQGLTGDEAADGDANSEFLGFNAASQGLVVYTRGTFPDTDFAWMSQPARPAVVTSPSSGKNVRRALVEGTVEVGRTVTCESGYWVEVRALSYRWQRNGHDIAGANAKRYEVTGADRARRLSCRVTAHGLGPALVVESRARRAS